MTTRTLSLELLNVLVLCVALSILLRDQFQHIGNSSNTITTSTKQQEDQRQLQRRLDTTFESAEATRQFASSSGLVSNFSGFVGSWYNCMHTSFTTFEGETEEKEVLHTIGCDHGLLGNITKVRETNEQALKFEFYQLNKCAFHGFGGEKGQRPCPNDSLPGSTGVKVDGKILVKYTFKGVGSFAESDRVQFYADQSYIRSRKGEWKADFERTKSENGDTMVCQKHLEGIVCDWHLNEYRTAAVDQSSGCKKDNRCKPGLGKQRCLGMGGEWTNECPRTKYIKEGFLYDSFGSHYLVQDVAKCNVQCPDAEEP